MFTKLGMDVVLMAQHMQKDVLAIYAQGRIKGDLEAKYVNGEGGGPSSKSFSFRPEGYSNKPKS